MLARCCPDGTDVTACSITSGTTRGFTNQEMIDSVCLANLNARLYDPTLGRLLVADPFVPNPFRGQSFNRYAYVENGPLSATDPSGYIETVVVTAQNMSGNPWAGTPPPSDFYQRLAASALQTSLPVAEAYRSVASGGMVYSGKASASGLARVLNTADAPRDTIKPVNDDISDNSDPTQGDFYIGYAMAGAQPSWCNGQCEWTPTDVGGYWQTSMAGATGSIEEVDVLASQTFSGAGGANTQVAANAVTIFKIINPDGTVQYVDAATFAAMQAKGDLGPATIERRISPARPLYRGGSIILRPNDVRIDKATGLLRPGYGISLNENPEAVGRFGTPTEIKSAPEGLEFTQRGRDPGHYELAPVRPMTMQEYQNLLFQIEVQ